MSRLIPRIEALEMAAKEDDPRALADALSAFIDDLPRQPGPIPMAEGRRALSALRRSRRFSPMLHAAQAILNDGSTDPQISRQYAQALIETGMPVAAISVLDQVIADEQTDATERADAMGVRGRAWKDIAVATRNTRADLAREAVLESYESYASVHRADPDALYHGINRIAVAAWDRGFVLPEKERQAALDTPGVFALVSTARQLTEMWRAPDTPEGQAILTALNARILELPGGRFTASTGMVAAMEAVPETVLEKVLGNTGTKTGRWLQRGLRTAHSVALIEHRGRGIGTGFLVRGRDLDDRLDDRPYLVTNAHVISDRGQDRAALPGDVLIRFEMSDNPSLSEEGIEVERIVWQSSIDDHDATILALRDLPDDAPDPLPLGRNLPLLDDYEGPSRVYIIGHPGGREGSFSFEDNELLDYEAPDPAMPKDPRARRLHYRAPTEPGSSGSPVLNSNWKVIGLHHAGSSLMRMLNGKTGRYPANEGIWIQSIRHALAQSDLT